MSCVSSSVCRMSRFCGVHAVANMAWIDRYRTRRRRNTPLSRLYISLGAFLIAETLQTTDQDRPIVDGKQAPAELKIEIPANRYAPYDARMD